ncbi:glyoxylate/hydroxypyruvate reductase A [Pseudomonas sp. LP_7_YM]|uniref:2-hydroxyacid dehydrogenase n=1 Tax=Pseudomonas sp. LP_7_YM TaxID=2485137 RepID=UPI00105EDBD5|nr:glyoxylate/hydroxypyruvate reductase A [Pseudomonas sp. LP_7_YM]TDV59710.1 glyoxylate/hydroxypyruvate reductase A [Pseudomonas sp. LP_7_YM]
MTPLVLLGSGNGLGRVREAMLARRPGLSIVRADEDGACQAQVALCWNPLPGSLGALPKLQMIHSIAAGADQIFKDPSRPPGIPVCRIVDPDHRLGMVEYVLWGVLHYHRSFDQMLARQAQAIWDRPAQRPARDVRIGVMGLGELGREVAHRLASLGFSTRGWARRAQALEGIETFEYARLDVFLDGLDMLVCLLPLTPQTAGILSEKTFSRLNHGAVLINCGRGEHLVRDDLVAALRSGQLRGALLDVFEAEPLPQDDSFWRTPYLIVTPHIASSASYEVIAEQILHNLDRLHAGTELANQVNPEHGY